MDYKAVLFLLALLGVGGFAIGVFAAPVGLKVAPGKVTYTLEPGEVLNEAIVLSNPNSTPVFVTTSVEDFSPDRGGGIKFVGRAEGVTTVRDWITQGATDFRLEGGAVRKMNFTITVPLDAEPGGHYGILFFKATAADEESGQLKVGTRLGVLVFITVPGDFVQSGKILGFSGPSFVQKGPLSFNINFENTGTVHFEPEGIVTVTNIFGKEIAELTTKRSVVLPTSQREIAVNWPTKRLFFGIYKAQAEIRDGEGNVLTTDVHRFIGFPIGYILGLFVILSVLYFGFRSVRKRVNFSVSLKK